MKEIQLTQGKVAIVDDEDFERLSQWKWYYSGGYARRDYRISGNRIRVYMHREILNPSPTSVVDHINHKTLDNQKINLRECNNNVENIRNSKLKKNNTSGYIGVYWSARKNKWISQIMLNRKLIVIGSFDDIKIAAKERDKRAKQLFGEFANLNFKDAA